MERNALKSLEAWGASPRRKPLLLYGARQVGKTYLLKEFGSLHFNRLEYYDLERQASARAAFDGDLDPRAIIGNLSQVSGHPIDPRESLIVLDEIQASNRALASLKYFHEELPEAHIAAAGSLLGVKVQNEGYSAPVGQVDTMTLHPLTFDEYLQALGQGEMVEGIRRCFDDGSAYFMHDRALELYFEYLLVGGMPEAVSVFAGMRDFDEVSRVQNTIRDLYIADMAKYAQPYETARILEAWRSIPAQLGKPNRKFQYKVVRSGGRASQFEGALAWLEAAGLIMRCDQITSAQLPLATHENRSAFKAYALDVGLLGSAMGLAPMNVLNPEGRRITDIGGLTENYVAQALVANGIDLRYWVSEGKAEIDFVIEAGNTSAIPIEVKSSGNVQAKSLGVFRRKYEPEKCIRISTKNFGCEGEVKSVPLYAAFCIERPSNQ